MGEGLAKLIQKYQINLGEFPSPLKILLDEKWDPQQINPAQLEDLLNYLESLSETGKLDKIKNPFNPRWYKNNLMG